MMAEPGFALSRQFGRAAALVFNEKTRGNGKPASPGGERDITPSRFPDR